MEPARPLRDVFAGLAGTDGEQAGPDARQVLAAHGHGDLPADLLVTAIGSYAGTAPAEVAEHLAAFLDDPARTGGAEGGAGGAEGGADGAEGGADGADGGDVLQGLALLAAAPTGPWPDEVPLDDMDIDGPDGPDELDGPVGLDGLDGAELAGLDAADRLDGSPSDSPDGVAAEPDDVADEPDDVADVTFGVGDSGFGEGDGLFGEGFGEGEAGFAVDGGELERPDALAWQPLGAPAAAADDPDPEIDAPAITDVEAGFGTGAAVEIDAGGGSDDPGPEPADD